MARRKRASMREGPLADLFRSTDKPEDPPEAPAPPPRREERDDETRVMPETPRDEAPERKSEPPPEREPIFDVEEEEPQREDVRAYRVEESAPEAPAPPTKKDRLSKIFAEDAEPAGATYGRDEPDYSRSSEPPRPHSPVIRVVGVGGAGVNAVNRMVEAGIPGVEFMAINTDLQSLQQSLADVTVHLGTGAQRGLGAGSNPELGYRSAFEEQDKIKRLLKGSDMVFVTAGAGGGTGTGAAPVVARLARDVGSLTVGIITKPFRFEGTRRAKQADEGVDALAAEVDTLIVVPNERLLSVLEIGRASCRERV